MTYLRLTLHYFRITLDIILLSASFLLAKYTILGYLPGELRHYFLLSCLVILWIITSRETKLYDEFRSRNFSYEFIVLLKIIILQPLACILLAFLINQVTFSRLFPLVYTGFLVLIMGTQKYLLRQFLNILRII